VKEARWLDTAVHRSRHGRGFGWLTGPGGGEEGAFYAYPEPPGYPDYPIGPADAYHSSSGELMLPYEVVATAPDPDRVLTEFLQTTYTAAELAGRDRAALEADPHPWDRQGP
jgi:hypothetical protein